MSNELISVTNSWLSLAIPHLGPIADTIGFVQSLSDKLLFDKLYYVLSRQDSDFEEWLKISEKFEADNKDYNKMVQQLIYYINAINEVDLLQAYANLLHAYKCTSIKRIKIERVPLAFKLTQGVLLCMCVILLSVLQNLSQHTVALVEAGNGIHDLMVGSMATGFVQLHRQIGQLPGMGSVMTDHVLHQRHQLFHGSMGVLMVMMFLIMMVVIRCFLFADDMI